MADASPRRSIALEDLIVRAELELRRADLPIRLETVAVDQLPDEWRLETDEWCVDAQTLEGFTARVVRYEAMWVGSGPTYYSGPDELLGPGIDSRGGPRSLAVAIMKRLYYAADDQQSSAFVERVNDSNATDSDFELLDAMGVQVAELKKRIRTILQEWAEDSNEVFVPSAAGIAAHDVLVEMWLEEAESSRDI